VEGALAYFEKRLFTELMYLVNLTFLKALHHIIWLVRSSQTRLEPNENIPYFPFLMEEHCRSAPSSFEVDVLINDVQYCYGFSYARNRQLDY
jgi:hypothetical protein